MLGRRRLKKEKLWSLILLLGVMLLIATLSLQPGPDSAALTNRIVRVTNAINQLVNGRAMDAEHEYIALRKLAHAVEYGLLGLGAGLFFRTWVPRHPARWAILFCMACSLIDQFSKVYIPGREFDITDFPFDVMGYVLLVLAVKAWTARNHPS